MFGLLCLLRQAKAAKCAGKACCSGCNKGKPWIEFGSKDLAKGPPSLGLKVKNPSACAHDLLSERI